MELGRNFCFGGLLPRCQMLIRTGGASADAWHLTFTERGRSACPPGGIPSGLGNQGPLGSRSLATDICFHPFDSVDSTKEALLTP